MGNLDTIMVISNVFIGLARKREEFACLESNKEKRLLRKGNKEIR